MNKNTPMFNMACGLQHKVRNNRFLVVLITTGLLFYVFSDAVAEVLARIGEDRYSHVPLVWAVSLYLIWLKRYEIAGSNRGAWYGVPVMLFAGLLLLMGDLSAIWTIVQYALVLLIIGLVWVLIGSQIRKIGLPLLLFFLTVPLPYMIDVMLSGKMQLLSSQIGVFIVRLLDIPVYLEGNVIDLGLYKLQVVEACSGLNYLFPLMTIGLIVAYIFLAPIWVRVVLFVSTIPITIFMNSFRIALVAVLVNQFGIESAEGFIHFFEGWVIFMICIVLLLAEIKIYNLASRSELSLVNSLDLHANTMVPDAREQADAFSFAPVLVGFAMIVLISLGTTSIGKRVEVVTPRQPFSNFPMQFDKWLGYSHPFYNNENSILKLSDYLLADYKNDDDYINVYIGYAETQRNGFVPHSPKACIPGGGWEINDTSIMSLNLKNGQQLKVTRLLIKREENTQIVYYWFRQRGRDLSNEYAMKFALLYDAIKINRTDGAIVRFTTPVTRSIEESEAKLQAFIGMVYPKLPLFVPD